MSEKRFTTDYSDFIQNDKTFIKRGNERLTYKEIVDLLNEQDNELHKYRTKNAELHITILENEKEIDEQQATIEQLKAQLREKEEDERLYADEIVKLNKEAKEVLEFKSLGGDY